MTHVNIRINGVTHGRKPGYGDLTCCRVWFELTTWHRLISALPKVALARGIITEDGEPTTDQVDCMACVAGVEAP